MNEITIHGNLAADPELSFSASTDRAFVRLKVLVNDGYYNRTTGKWVEQNPVGHWVVAFGQLAENIADTFSSGHAIMVTGRFRASNWLDDQGNRRYGQQLVAQTAGADLRFATAQITKNPKRAAQTEPEGEQMPAAEGEQARELQPV